MKYIIKFKEYGNKWMATSYTAQGEVTEEYLIDFFGLRECEDIKIEKEND